MEHVVDIALDIMAFVDDGMGNDCYLRHDGERGSRCTAEMNDGLVDFREEALTFADVLGVNL